MPQRLDVLLSRLHDSLDHDDATDAAASAHRCRGVRARQGVLPGSAVLSVTGPETDIAAVYETARKAAVAAHGVEGESRSLQQLMYDCTLDVLLHGFNTAPVSVSTSTDDSGTRDGDETASAGDSDVDHEPAVDATTPVTPTTPATPHERLGDPRVPQRKAIQATILVTVPAATAAGASNEPGQARRVGIPPGRRGTADRRGGQVLDPRRDRPRRRRDPRLRLERTRHPHSASPVDLDAVRDLRRTRLPRQRPPRRHRSCGAVRTRRKDDGHQPLRTLPR